MKVFRWIIFTAIILLALGIFAFSAQPKSVSGELSRKVTTKIVELYQQVTGSVDTEHIYEIVEDIHGITRKYAHFALYTALGVLTALFLTSGNKQKTLRSGLTAWILCILYSISDEYHQTLVAGRSGELRDVLIDSAGALLGITAVLVICRYISRKKINTD